MNITKPLSIFTESAYFRYFILGVIILSAVIIGIETYPDAYRQHYNLLHLLDRMILAIFTVEILLKILARGIRPWDYFKDPWNVFDFIVVAVCFIPAIDTHYVAVLRLARILRVFRVISIFPKLQLLVGALLKSIPSMGYVVLLLALIFYIYAVLGTFLFGGKDPVHFGNLHLSMITLFKVLTLEGWTDILNIQFYGTTDPLAEYTSKPVSYGSFLYFVSFILIGAMVIMNLFIGVIMNSMQESQQEMEKLLKYKTRETSDVKAMIADLDKKIDDLKANLSILKDNLK
ncbi:MAG: ion transporter [Bacteroidales bacterium]|nr:ion transporter [Bacteroidales bacterium]